ncbi:MAG TPA: HAD family hydrolase [Anaerolineales bacterium]
MTTPSGTQLPTARRLFIAFDADDTLWHNETHYQRAGGAFKQLLQDFAGPDAIEKALGEIEVRNIGWYGYGIKSYTLSMIEAAVAITGGKVSGAVIDSILQLGRDMLAADVMLFEHAASALTALARDHDLMLITKGDLLEQSEKLKRSGLTPLFKYVEIIQDKTAESYRSLLQRHGIPIDKFIMVGNSLKSDILPVIEIDGRAVFVPYEHTWSHEHVDAPNHGYFEIGHLGLLPELVNRLNA